MLGTGQTRRGNRMDRRDMLKASGAAMIVSSLPAAAAQEMGKGGWDQAKLEKAAGVMGDWVKDGRVAGATILVSQGSRQGNRQFVRNFGTAKGNDPVFLLASITKPMTAAAVMSLV